MCDDETVLSMTSRTVSDTTSPQLDDHFDLATELSPLALYNWSPKDYTLIRQMRERRIRDKTNIIPLHTPRRLSCCYTERTSWWHSEHIQLFCSSVPLWKIVAGLAICIGLTFYDHSLHVNFKQRVTPLTTTTSLPIPGNKSFSTLQDSVRLTELHGDHNSEPVWLWDHNVYNPTRGLQQDNQQISQLADTEETFSQRQNKEKSLVYKKESMSLVTSRPRSLLLAQVAGTNFQENFVDMTSRPNRAYAHQWGRDYVCAYLRHRPDTIESSPPSVTPFLPNSSSPSASTLTICPKHNGDYKAQVLNEILQQQIVALGLLDRRATLLQLAQNFTDVRIIPTQAIYDVVVLLPPDAIITDLDYDLLHLCPRDKLICIPGWKGADTTFNTASQSSEDNIDFTALDNVVFFNLRHELSQAVAHTWWNMLKKQQRRKQSEGQMSLSFCARTSKCDLQLLLNAVESVAVDNAQRMKSNSTAFVSWPSLIHGLVGPGDGSVLATEENRQANNKVYTHQRHHVIVRAFASLQQQEHRHSILPMGQDTDFNDMSLSDLDETQVAVQRASDAVCYRYYPKCEVL